jgi:hypothetical protein
VVCSTSPLSSNFSAGVTAYEAVGTNGGSYSLSVPSAGNYYVLAFVGTVNTPPCQSVNLSDYLLDVLTQGAVGGAYAGSSTGGSSTTAINVTGATTGINYSFNDSTLGQQNGVSGGVTYTGSKGSVSGAHPIIIQQYSDPGYSNLYSLPVAVNCNNTTYSFQATSANYFLAFYDLQGNGIFSAGDPYEELGTLTPSLSLVVPVNFGDTNLGPIVTPTPTSTPTFTSTETFTLTQTPLPTNTFTTTPTPSATPSITPTPTASPTKTPSSTPSITSTLTATPTSSPTLTRTISPTPTSSPTNTATPTVTATSTVTFTPTVILNPPGTWTQLNLNSLSGVQEWGMAYDATGGVIYIAEDGGSAIGTGNVGGVSVIGSGFGYPTFQNTSIVVPIAVAYDQVDSQIFISNEENNTILAEGVDSNFGTTYRTYDVGVADDNGGGVAVDQSTKCNSGPCLYGTNGTNVYEFNVNNGGAVTTFSTYSGGTLNNPYGLAVNGAGTTLVVGDSSAIVQMEIGSNTAQVFSTYYNGTTNITLSPNFVALDSSGNIYVTNTSPAVVVELSPTGETLAVYSHSFTYPNGVALDASNNLYVSDAVSGNNTLWKYAP